MPVIANRPEGWKGTKAPQARRAARRAAAEMPPFILKAPAVAT